MQQGDSCFDSNGHSQEMIVFGRAEKARYRRARGLNRNSFRSPPSSPSFTLQHCEEKPVPRCTEFDLAYFQSYSHVGIHEEMIKDRVRTETYRAAIMKHQSHIAGKVVVDVGCGTGILSIFCAQAGAKRVYAVDASEIAVQANEVVKANNLSDKIIVLHGRVEDVNIEEEVDVIISEWMGYMLLYESMLGSVITARDRWLKPGGLILPSHASLYMAPVTHPDRYSDSIDFWRNVYGIDMSAMLPLAKQCAFEEPSIETITGENVLTWPFVVKYVDCYTITMKELESVTAKYRFESMMRAPLHGFGFWFEVEFNGPAASTGTQLHFLSHPPSSDVKINGSDQRKKRLKSEETLTLSTAPEDSPTHWQQTLIYFYDPIEVNQDQVIEGSVTISQSRENARFLNIHLEYTVVRRRRSSDGGEREARRGGSARKSPGNDRKEAGKPLEQQTAATGGGNLDFRRRGGDGDILRSTSNLDRSKGIPRASVSLKSAVEIPRQSLN